MHVLQCAVYDAIYMSKQAIVTPAWRSTVRPTPHTSHMVEPIRSTPFTSNPPCSTNINPPPSLFVAYCPSPNMFRVQFVFRGPLFVRVHCGRGSAYFQPMSLRWCIRVYFLFLTRLYQQVYSLYAHEFIVSCSCSTTSWQPRCIFPFRVSSSFVFPRFLLSFSTSFPSYRDGSSSSLFRVVHQHLRKSTPPPSFFISHHGSADPSPLTFPLFPFRY